MLGVALFDDTTRLGANDAATAAATESSKSKVKWPEGTAAEAAADGVDIIIVLVVGIALIDGGPYALSLFLSMLSVGCVVPETKE